MPTRYYLLLAGSLLAAGPVAQAQSLPFAPVVTYPTGGYDTWAVDTGDVTGDGVPDVVAAAGNSGLSVLVGLGDGTLGAAIVYPVPFNHYTERVKLGDLNQDGRLDVVLASHIGVSVQLNLGGGVFGAATLYPLALSGAFGNLELGDVNGDGWLDVVTGFLDAGAIYVLPGQPGGTLGTAQPYATGVNNPMNLALGDVTGDGRLDVVATSPSGSAPVFVMPGNASNGFATTRMLGGYGSTWVTLSDVNHDGRLDIMADDQSPTGGMLTFLALGNDDYVYSPVYHVPMSGTHPLLADLNDDALPDLLVPKSGSTNLLVALGSSSGFGTATSYSAGPGSAPTGVAVADLDLDGRPDLVTPNHDSNTIGVLLSTLPALNPAILTSGGASSSLTLRGHRLTGATAVTFTSAVGATTAVAASSFAATSYVSPTQSITLPVPTLASGTYAMRATTPLGTTNSVALVVSGTLAAASLAASFGLELAPNPAHTTTVLHLAPPPGTTSVRLWLHDGLGRTVQAHEVAAKPSLSLSLEGLVPGLYLLAVEAGGQRFTRRLVVE